MTQEIYQQITLSSQLIFGAIGMVAYSISANIRSKQQFGVLGQNFVDALLYSRGFGFLIFAVFNFIGILSIFTIAIFKSQFEVGQYENLPFFVFYFAVCWIFIIALIDIVQRKQEM